MAPRKSFASGISSLLGKGARKRSVIKKEEVMKHSPLPSGTIESTLDKWITTQKKHSNIVEMMRTSRLTRREAVSQGYGIDPYFERCDFYHELKQSEIIFFINNEEDGVQLFQLHNSDVEAVCLFTSMKYCQLFSEKMATSLKQDTSVIKDVGSKVVAMKDYKEVDIPLSFNGTWQPAEMILETIADLVQTTVSRIQVVVNPMSDKEVVVPLPHLFELSKGDLRQILVSEVDRLFSPFFEQYCPEVKSAYSMCVPCHPTLPITEPVTLLLVQSSNFNSTCSTIEWGKLQTSELESQLTTFSTLHIHEVHEMPREIDDCMPFYILPDEKDKL